MNLLSPLIPFGKGMAVLRIEIIRLAKGCRKKLSSENENVVLYSVDEKVWRVGVMMPEE